MHYKQLLDPALFLGPQDFVAEREVAISRVTRGEMPNRDGAEKQFAPMLYIMQRDGKEYPRPYKVPKSVLYGLSLHLGNDADAWAGKKITIFSAHCMAFGQREECLRVRFTTEIDQQILKWLKKRKASASAYMLPTEKVPT